MPSLLAFGPIVFLLTAKSFFLQHLLSSPNGCREDLLDGIKWVAWNLKILQDSTAPSWGWVDREEKLDQRGLVRSDLRRANHGSRMLKEQRAGFGVWVWETMFENSFIVL
jgi:hypothetical protein